MVRSAKKLIIF